MIGDLFRAMRRLKQARHDLQEASAEHSEAARELIATSDEISRGTKRADKDREAALDALVKRMRLNGAAE